MNLQLAVLAAWLHDIGKFAQRAGVPASKDLPHNNYRYAHEAYTDYFIEHILKPFLPGDLAPQCSILARMAAGHHNPDLSEPQDIAIQKADGLSAGLDRTQGESEGDYKSARLEAIFNRVKLDDRSLPPDNHRRYSLMPMNKKGAIFPTQEPGGSYPQLFADFCADLKYLPLDQGVRAWQATLVSLLERYTWCIPSSTYHTLADTSLFDHAATTAAITQALLLAPEGKFLLFGGDLSGIQEFIFGKEEPADHGANKLLRARSFLLQAVTRSVWLAAIERLGLEPAARIMDAGGRFVLLLPDNPTTVHVLSKLQEDVERWLLSIFYGSVRLNLATLPLTSKDLEREKFSACFNEFNDRLEQAKLQPFACSFNAGVSPVQDLAPDSYAKYGECAWCHSRPAVKEEDDRPICQMCANLIELGGQLPTSRYVVYGRDAAIPGKSLLFDRMKLALYRERPPTQVVSHAIDVLSVRDDLFCTVTPVAGHIPMISQEDMERWQAEGRLVEKDGETLFAVDPCQVGSPKTFAMLAEEARIAPANPGERWRSIPCLAVCKADVDNLGLIFGLGLKESFTLSRFAMLARMLNYFFSAVLMRKVRKEFADIYVVFAGGDDLFVIGPWDKTIEFARVMATDFADFCAHNPAVTISAGLPLIKPQLPMRAMRQEAEAALEEAKNHAGKNAATMFDVSASWPDFATHLENGHWLEGMCLDGTISQGFLRRLLGYSRQCRAFMQGHLAPNGLYKSHFIYDLARNWPPDKKPRERKKLQEMVNNVDFFVTAEIGISWALYRTRNS